VFLERVFQKLLLNFTWWVNRKDAEGSNVFEGGFLGLDNIGVFDRSAPLPTGGFLQQSDGTSWMGMYCLNLLAIAMELARENPAYEDVASKFWEHFLYIGHAMGHQGKNRNMDLWDDEDGFFYDCLRLSDGGRIPLKIRSMVGLVPLFAVETLEPELLARLPDFTRRLEWFIEHREDLTDNVACMQTPGHGERGRPEVVHSSHCCSRIAGAVWPAWNCSATARHRPSGNSVNATRSTTADMNPRRGFSLTKNGRNPQKRSPASLEIIAASPPRTRTITTEFRKSQQTVRRELAEIRQHLMAHGLLRR